MKKLTIVFALMAMVMGFFGCKKGINSDVKASINLTEKFFALPTNTKPEVKKVYDHLKQKNSIKPFVETFAAEEGLPVWNKAIVAMKHSTQYFSKDLGASEDIAVLIPLVLENQEFVKGFIAATVDADNVIMQLYRGEDYKDYAYGKFEDQGINAEKVATQIIMFEKDIFNKEKYRITDKDLFKDQLQLPPNKMLTNKEGILEISQSNASTSQARGCVVIEVSFCDGSDYCLENGCDWNSNCPTTCGGWIIELCSGVGGGGENTDPGIFTPTVGIPSGGGSSNPGGSTSSNPNDPFVNSTPPHNNHTGWVSLDEDGRIDENGFAISAMNQLSKELESNPFAITPCDEIAKFQNYGFGNLIQDINTEQANSIATNRIANLVATNADITQNSLYIKDINSAGGAVVNTDYFAIRINNMPTINGQLMTPSSLLEYFRKNINTFITPNLFQTQTSFSPYNSNGINDITLWNSNQTSSIGSIVHIYLGIFQDGTVIESNYQNQTTPTTDDYFTFSTMVSPFDGIHPVSGNRRFGIKSYVNPTLGNTNTFDFYISGVDRITNKKLELASWAKGFLSTSGFQDADALWRDIQSNFKNFINNNGGTSLIGLPESEIIARPKWNDVKDYLNGNLTLQQLKTKMGC